MWVSESHRRWVNKAPDLHERIGLALELSGLGGLLARVVLGPDIHLLLSTHHVSLPQYQVALQR